MPKSRKMLNDWNAPYVKSLMELIECQDKETIANWAVDYGQEVILPLWNKYGDPNDLRPQNALVEARKWISGSIKLPQAKEAILKCHEAARESEGNSIAQGAARTIGQAASSIHSTRHAMGLVFYGALALAYDRLGTDAPWDELLEAAEMECYRMESALRAVSDAKIQNPRMEKADRIDRKLFADINQLQEICTRYEKIALKLELDYKLLDGGNGGTTEFLYFDGEQLVGYIGICSFGGENAPLEITGMVHPGYRRCGVFSALHKEVLDEIGHRKAKNVLLLCDRKSGQGQKFLRLIGADHVSSEIEMYLDREAHQQAKILNKDIEFIKATDRDAGEVARQNAIYFGDPGNGCQGDEDQMANLLPEEEEKRGMTIYLVRSGEVMIGKVHLSLASGVGGIYGLGVLPEHRGKGFGRTILEKGVQTLMEAGVDDILLQVATDNATALNLYTSVGFQQTSIMDYYQFVPSTLFQP